MTVRTIYPIGSEGVDFERLKAAINGGAFTGAAMYDGGDKDTGVLVTSPAAPLADGATLTVMSKKTTGQATTWKQAKLGQTNVPNYFDNYYFGTLAKHTGMEAFPILSKSLAFRKTDAEDPNSGALTEAGYFSGELVRNPPYDNLPLYADYSYMPGMGVILRFAYQYDPNPAVVGYVLYDTGEFFIQDVAGDFTDTGISVSYAVGSLPIQTTRTNITITGEALVGGVQQTVIEGAVGKFYGLYGDTLRSSDNMILWLDGQANAPVTIQKIKFQRSSVGISVGTPVSGGSPVRVENCAFERMEYALFCLISKQNTYPNLNSGNPYDYSTTPNSASWVKGCTVKDCIYSFSGVVSELTVETSQFGPFDEFDDVQHYPASYQIILGHVALDGWDTGLNLNRNVSIRNNTFTNLHGDGSTSTLYDLLTHLGFPPEYEGFSMGAIIDIEAEGPVGATELIDVVDNTFTGFKSLETGVLAIMAGWGAEIKKVTFDGNTLSKVVGPVFYAIPTATHFTDPYFSGRYSEITVSGNKMVDLLNQDLYLPNGPLGTGDMVRKPTMFVQGPGDFGYGSAMKVYFQKNDYKDSDRLPIDSFGGDVGTSLVLLDPTTHECVVQENGGLPTGGGGSKNYITNMSYYNGMTDNRVVGLPANSVIKPAGIGQAFRQADTKSPFAMNDSRGTPRAKAYTKPVKPSHP